MLDIQPFIASLLTLLVAMVASRRIGDRAIGVLSEDQRTQLGSALANGRRITTLAILGLITAFWFLASRTQISRQALSLGFFSLLFGVVVARLWHDQKQLLAVGSPDACRRTLALTEGVSYLGIALFFYLMVLEIPLGIGDLSRSR